MVNNTSLSANTSIRTAIKNDLRLNYQTRLWLDVISSSAVELKEKIEKAMEDNPFLEYDIKDKYTSKSSSSDIDSIIENTAANGKESLFSHLKSQIEISFKSKKEIYLAEQICGFINHDGYLKTTSEEMSNILNVSVSEMLFSPTLIKLYDAIGPASLHLLIHLTLNLSYPLNFTTYSVFQGPKKPKNCGNYAGTEVQKNPDIYTILNSANASDIIHPIGNTYGWMINLIRGIPPILYDNVGNACWKANNYIAGGINPIYPGTSRSNNDFSRSNLECTNISLVKKYLKILF